MATRMLALSAVLVALAGVDVPAFSEEKPAPDDATSICRTGQFADAIPACTTIIEAAASSDSDRVSALAFRALALTRRAAEEDTKSQEDWLDCLHAEPEPGMAACSRLIDDPSESNSRRADALYNRSKRLLDKGQNVEAMADFQRALKDFTDHQAGSRQLAIADYTSALKLDPKQSRLLAYRGQLRLALADYVEALTDFESALAINDKEKMALFGRALLREAGGRPVEALADLKALMALPADTEEEKLLNKAASDFMSRLGAD